MDAGAVSVIVCPDGLPVAGVDSFVFSHPVNKAKPNKVIITISLVFIIMSYSMVFGMCFIYLQMITSNRHASRERPAAYKQKLTDTTDSRYRA
ncbi:MULTISPECIES: hypothetical protein [Methylobacter]|uniref:hypothetical protein n=1 Tax=Methylobacter TaxID=429 RepID=UPI00036A62E1|nr:MULTISPECIES: hypothetical protein [Methylobacter]